MSTSELLRIAVPNKGSLAEAAAQMLREAGYRQRNDPKELVLTDEENGVEFYYLRPRDIAVYVGEGTLDIGITGRDMLLDSGAEAHEVMELGFGGTRFRFAAPNGLGLTTADLAGKRIATSYPGLVKRYLDRIGVQARLIQLDGAVESSVRLGVADVIADVVETGTTLRQAGLELFGEPILESQAVLISRSETPSDCADLLLRRLKGVITARTYHMIDYNVPKAKLEQAFAITPGLDSPTVSPLAQEGWVAVRAMIPRAESQRIMDALWDVGAEAILVTTIHACRL
ncbi:MAG: ATP phosphoribosyltransferase [Propionibacteriaceae bacterium]|jgi:ATP phosphoribosyltransferase|nr:ATP phosphoribosyltransferase [Propionibacteriaceae bacterium]